MRRLAFPLTLAIRALTLAVTLGALVIPSQGAAQTVAGDSHPLGDKDKEKCKPFDLTPEKSDLGETEIGQTLSTSLSITNPSDNPTVTVALEHVKPPFSIAQSCKEKSIKAGELR